ncbi:MAG: universal stress protein [Bacteroidales bacterium]|nr:universal stress protein [Bacteroidales bacterium]
MEKYDFIRPIIRKNNSQLIVMGITTESPQGKISKVVEMVDTLKDKLAEDEIKVKTNYNISINIPEQVLAFARKNKVDLIVITANIDISLKSFFVGRYAQQIVNHSKVPVLSILPALIPKSQEPHPHLGIDTNFNPTLLLDF